MRGIRVNILFCSAGRRGELLKDFRKTMGNNGVIVAVDNSNIAPALYCADKRYLAPRIDDPGYVDFLLDICKKESIDAITTLIDPEIEVLADNREKFEALGVLVLTPYPKCAQLCFDKFKMYKHLVDNNIPTVNTYGDLDSFIKGQESGEIVFPVFVKPRNGSGSIGARRIDTVEELRIAIEEDPTLIIQELMTAEDVDADIYVDAISHELVNAFTKKKLSTTIGGANKTVSFKDDSFFEAIKRAVAVLNLCGPSDIDFFYKDGEYLLSEVNPRFGGAYLHAYGAGVDFVKLIENNVEGTANKPVFGDYEDGVVMMMFDSVIIKKQEELAIQQEV
ncbi:MAG: ATP-grasp domain-containing protein [Eggerthellaceae bacterium]